MKHCPRCRNLMSAITSRGPADHRVAPCGCRVSTRQLRALDDSENPRDTAGTPTRVVTDGGRVEDPRASCRECAARWSAHAGAQWVRHNAAYHVEQTGHSVCVDVGPVDRILTGETKARADGGRSEQWTPEPASLRTGETSEATHTRRTLAMLRRGLATGDLQRENLSAETRALLASDDDDGGSR